MGDDKKEGDNTKIQNQIENKKQKPIKKKYRIDKYNSNDGYKDEMYIEQNSMEYNKEDNKHNKSNQHINNMEYDQSKESMEYNSIEHNNIKHNSINYNNNIEYNNNMEYNKNMEYNGYECFYNENINETYTNDKYNSKIENNYKDINETFAKLTKNHLQSTNNSISQNNINSSQNPIHSTSQNPNFNSNQSNNATSANNNSSATKSSANNNASANYSLSATNSLVNSKSSANNKSSAKNSLSSNSKDKLSNDIASSIITPIPTSISKHTSFKHDNNLIDASVSPFVYNSNLDYKDMDDDRCEYKNHIKYDKDTTDNVHDEFQTDNTYDNHTTDNAICDNHTTDNTTYDKYTSDKYDNNRGLNCEDKYTSNENYKDKYTINNDKSKYANFTTDKYNEFNTDHFKSDYFNTEDNMILQNINVSNDKALNKNYNAHGINETNMMNYRPHVIDRYNKKTDDKNNYDNEFRNHEINNYAANNIHEINNHEINNNEANNIHGINNNEFNNHEYISNDANFNDNLKYNANNNHEYISNNYNSKENHYNDLHPSYFINENQQLFNNNFITDPYNYDINSPGILNYDDPHFKYYLHNINIENQYYNLNCNNSGDNLKNQEMTQNNIAYNDTYKGYNRGNNNTSNKGNYDEGNNGINNNNGNNGINNNNGNTGNTGNNGNMNLNSSGSSIIQRNNIGHSQRNNSGHSQRQRNNPQNNLVNNLENNLGNNLENNAYISNNTSSNEKRFDGSYAILRDNQFIDYKNTKPQNKKRKTKKEPFENNIKRIYVKGSRKRPERLSFDEKIMHKKDYNFDCLRYDSKKIKFVNEYDRYTYESLNGQEKETNKDFSKEKNKDKDSSKETVYKDLSREKDLSKQFYINKGGYMHDNCINKENFINKDSFMHDKGIKNEVPYYNFESQNSTEKGINNDFDYQQSFALNGNDKGMNYALNNGSDKCIKSGSPFYSFDSNNTTDRISNTDSYYEMNAHNEDFSSYYINDNNSMDHNIINHNVINQNVPSQYDDHLYTFDHNIYNEHETENLSSSIDYIYSCEPCMKKFKRLSTLKIHIFSHIQNADIFKCPKISCDSGFKSQAIALKHINHFHRDEKNVLEELLKRSKYTTIFRSYTALIDYFNLIKIANPFMKNFCFGCFTYPRSMDEHPCTKMFYYLQQCPSCRKEIEGGDLEEHVHSDECRRPSITIKDIESLK